MTNRCHIYLITLNRYITLHLFNKRYVSVKFLDTLQLLTHLSNYVWITGDAPDTALFKKELVTLGQMS